jgi:hypothetical protein
MQTVREMVVKGPGPLIILVASQAAVQDFQGYAPILMARAVERLMRPVFMTVGAGGEIFGMLFEFTLGILFPVHAQLVLLDHGCMGKALVVCRVNQMADGCAIDLL